VKTGRPKTVNREPWTTTINPVILRKLKVMATWHGDKANEALERIIEEAYGDDKDWGVD
jgi:hypothetical protein